MKADSGLFENYAIAHRLGIGVNKPLTSIDDMPIDEYDEWAAYFTLSGESLRIKE
jgi:hypothetical protein